MSLSSGTLNLKFMQRAAARNASKPAAKPADKGTSTGAAGTPAAGSGPATPNLPSTPGVATPDSAASPAPADAADDAARWFLPRRAVPSAPTATAGPSRPRVQFVASYLPFVEDGGADVGRRSFGGFGTNEDGEEDGDEEDEEEDGDENMDDVDVPQLRKGKRKDGDESMDADVPQSHKGKRKDAGGPREFLRPAGFSPPRTNAKNTATSKSKQPGSAVSTPSHSSRPSPAPGPAPSQADKLRDTISGLKTVSVSKKRGAESDGGAPKRAKVDGASRDSTPGRSADKSGAAGAGKNSKPSGKGGKVEATTGTKSKNWGADTGGALKGRKDKPSALDERERQLKAAKKAKKRAAAA